MDKKSQIDSLADYIMGEIPGEPSEDQGAGDTAIRLLKNYRSKISIYQKVVVLILFLVLALMVGCGDPPVAPAATVTAHIYTNNDGGSVINCPEELDPAPTEWTYNGTIELPEDEVLEQCELE